MAFDQHQRAKRLLAAFNDGSIGLLDSLQKPASAMQRLTLHDRKVSHVDAHPTSEHLIVTASNDGSAKIWDLRKCRKPSDALHTFMHGATACRHGCITGVAQSVCVGMSRLPTDDCYHGSFRGSLMDV